MTDDHDDLRRALLSVYEFGDDFPHQALLSRISSELTRDNKPTRQMSWAAGVAAATLAVLVVAGLIGFQRWRNVAPIHSPAPSVSRAQAGVAAVLANNHLTYIPPGADKPIWDIAVAPPPDLTASHGYAGLGHRVASSTNGNQIFALPARDSIGGAQLVVVDTVTGKVLHDIKLPNPGGSAHYGALTVGPSGDIWIVGSVGPVADQDDLRSIRIEILRVNRQDWSITSWLGRDMSHWVPEGPVGGDFTIYQVQVTSDEKRAYYSYSGGLLSKAGLDWVDMVGSVTKACVPPASDAACIPGLAGFLVQGSGVYITTGNDSPSGAIDFYGLDGILRKHIELGLRPGFLMDFAASPDGTNLYLFGSCGYSPGVAKLDLATQRPTVIVKPESLMTEANPPCGQSSAFASAKLIAIGHVAALKPHDTDGKILFVDSASGMVTRSVAVPSEPIAIIAAGG